MDHHEIVATLKYSEPILDAGSWILSSIEHPVSLRGVGSTSRRPGSVRVKKGAFRGTNPSETSRSND